MRIETSPGRDACTVYLDPSDIVVGKTIYISLPDVYPWVLWNSWRVTSFQMYSSLDAGGLNFDISGHYSTIDPGIKNFVFCNWVLGTTLSVLVSSINTSSVKNTAVITCLKNRPTVGPILGPLNSNQPFTISGTSSRAQVHLHSNAPSGLAQGYIQQIMITSVSATGGTMSSWDVTIGHTGEARSGGTGDAFQWKYAVDASSGTDFTLNSTVYTLFNCWGFPKFFNNSTSTLPGSINNPVASFPCIDNTTGATISGRVIKWVSVPAFPDEGVDLFVGATPGTGVTSFTVGGFLAYSEIY